MNFQAQTLMGHVISISLTPAVLSIDPDSRYAYDDAEALLAGSTEQLAHLRFTIILVARWVSSRSVTPQRRKELRTERARLRGLYLGMVDELAMAYGVHQALMTRNYVERTICVPTGMLPPANLSWTKRVKHPSEIVKKGEKVKAVVLGVEPQNRRLSLGIKQLQSDVWESFFATHRVGDQVHGKVLRTAQFGAFVEIAEGVEGLCHISEAGEDAATKLETGLEHDFKIIKINVEEKKVGLSLRATSGHEASRAQVESYKKESHKAPVSSSTTTLGDLINLRKSEKNEKSE